MKKILFLLLFTLPLMAYGTFKFPVYKGKLDNFTDIEIVCVDNHLEATVTGKDGVKVKKATFFVILKGGTEHPLFEIDYDRDKNIENNTAMYKSGYIDLDDLFGGTITIGARLKEDGGRIYAKQTFKFCCTEGGEPIPLDGGLSFLLASGLGLGLFRRFKNKK